MPARARAAWHFKKANPASIATRTVAGSARTAGGLADLMPPASLLPTRRRRTPDHGIRAIRIPVAVAIVCGHPEPCQCPLGKLLAVARGALSSFSSRARTWPSLAAPGAYLR